MCLILYIYLTKSLEINMCANSYTMTRASSMLKELIHHVLVENVCERYACDVVKTPLMSKLQGVF